MGIEHITLFGKSVMANLSVTASQIASAVPNPSAIPYWMFIVLVSVFGFASAGLFNAVRQYTTGNSGIGLSFAGPANIVWTFLLCMFMAPYWIGVKSWVYWWQGKLSLANLAFFLILAVMWSFCSGVIVLQFLFSMGMVGN